MAKNVKINQSIKKSNLVCYKNKNIKLASLIDEIAHTI